MSKCYADRCRQLLLQAIVGNKQHSLRRKEVAVQTSKSHSRPHDKQQHVCDLSVPAAVCLPCGLIWYTTMCRQSSTQWSRRMRDEVSKALQDIGAAASLLSTLLVQAILVCHCQSFRLYIARLASTSVSYEQSHRLGTCCRVISFPFRLLLRL